METKSELASRFSAHVLRAGLRRALGRQVLAPGDDLHAEGLRIASHARAEPAQPDDAEALALEHRAAAQALVPAPGAHVALGFCEVTRRGEDQQEAELRGDGAGAPGLGAAHQHAALGAGVQIEARRAQTRERDELELRQPLDERTRKRRALAHQHENLERREFRRRVLHRGKGLVKHRHLDPAPAAAPVGRGEREALVVVKNR
jgi:hypothetical protein